MYHRIAATSFLLILGACSSVPPTSDSSSKIPVVTTAASVPNGDSVTIERLNKTLATRSVYFAYDNFVIDPKFQAAIKDNVAFIKAVPGASLVLEGNTDERGSSEYNLSLGQKRADVVRKSLILLGLPEAKIEAISFGKEKPKALCNDESCWKENRRVDFVIKSIDSKK